MQHDAVQGKRDGGRYGIAYQDHFTTGADTIQTGGQGIRRAHGLEDHVEAAMRGLPHELRPVRGRAIEIEIEVPYLTCSGQLAVVNAGHGQQRGPGSFGQSADELGYDAAPHHQYPVVQTQS